MITQNSDYEKVNKDIYHPRNGNYCVRMRLQGYIQPLGRLYPPCGTDLLCGILPEQRTYGCAYVE